MNLVSTLRPAYRILSIHGFFGPDDTLYQEGEEIYFDGEPNEEMEPLNEPARIKLEAYLNKLDNQGREAAAKAGKAYAGRPRSLDGALVIATAIQRSEMGLMGVNRSESKEISRVVEGEVQETSIVNPKRGRGRPRKDGSISMVAA